MGGSGKEELKVNNILMIKRIEDDPDVDGGLNLIGTMIQTVFDPEDKLKLSEQKEQKEGSENSKKVEGEDLFAFDYRFNDLTPSDDNMQLRHRKTDKYNRKEGGKANAVTSTYQVKIPMSLHSTKEMFPFHILKAKIEIELSSTEHYKPDLLFSKVDRRQNGNIQKLDSRSVPFGKRLIDLVQDKIDRTVAYNFVSPYPRFRFECEPPKMDDQGNLKKKGSCARTTIEFGVIKDGWSRFVTVIMPMFLVCVINGLNVWHDIAEEGGGDPFDVLGVSSALTLTAVFLLPEIMEETARSSWNQADNWYIISVFVSLVLSSIPAAAMFGDSGNGNWKWIGAVGAGLFFLSFIIPLISLVRYIKLNSQMKAESTHLVPYKELSVNKREKTLPDEKNQLSVVGVIGTNGDLIIPKGKTTRKSRRKIRKIMEVINKDEPESEASHPSVRNPFVPDTDYDKKFRYKIKTDFFEDHFVDSHEILDSEGAEEWGYSDVSTIDGKFEVIAYTKIPAPATNKNGTVYDS